MLAAPIAQLKLDLLDAQIHLSGSGARFGVGSGLGHSGRVASWVSSGTRQDAVTGTSLAARSLTSGNITLRQTQMRHVMSHRDVP